ncbi:MAG: hypothetical protein AB8F34_08325 [Akkermansiaceae bacterium]
MFNSKSLTDDQITTIKSWVDEGAQLPDIQKKMESELNERLTYMDTRFLILDLGLELKTEVAEGPEDQETETATAEVAEENPDVLAPDAASGNVKVTVDEIARPGVMASGRVTFADGQGGMWYVDDMGRLGVDPDTEGYQPSEADVIAFQQELKRMIG